MFWWTAFPCIALGKAPPDLKAPLPETVADPDRWLADRLVEEAALGVWPQAMPRIHLGRLQGGFWPALQGIGLRP